MSQLVWTQADVAAGNAPKARKQCSKCQDYYHAKRPACPVCHPDTVVVIQKCWDEPGRKRKQCHSCKKYIGHSQNVCPNCQAEQIAAVAVSVADNVPDPPKTELDVKQHVQDHVQPEQSALTPRTGAGHWPLQDRNDAEGTLSARTCGCRNDVVFAVGVMPGDKKPPTFPVDTTADNVLDWAHKVVDWGHTRNGHVSPSALRSLALASLGAGTAYDMVYKLLLNYGCRMDLPTEEFAEEEIVVEPKLQTKHKSPEPKSVCEHEFTDDKDCCLNCGEFIGF